MAVGGNALTVAGQAGTYEQIAENAEAVAVSVADVVRSGRQVVVVHGNGPQVGALALQQDLAAGRPDPAGRSVPVQPLHQLGAMTQGQLGSALVRALDRHLGTGRAVALVTHVAVDPADPAFGQPAKPVGPFFDMGQAHRLAAERGWDVVEDAGRGWRRVVPSPAPLAVLELGAVRALLDAGHVVLAAGGGGVPVRRAADGAWYGVDAVIDKDATAALLALEVGARELHLVTGVDAVLLDAGTPAQRPVHTLTTDEARRHLADGQFPPGSMGPKVRAALRFVEGGGQRAVVTSAQLLPAAARGAPGAGTRIEAAPDRLVAAR